MNTEDIKKGILHFISKPSYNSPDRMGHTILEIKEFLKLNNVEKSIDDIKKLLSEMEKEELIEERHMGKRIDYALENAGIQIIEKFKEEISDKWNLPKLS